MELAKKLGAKENADTSENPLCKLFTQKEASDYLGAPVEDAMSDPIPIPHRTGCAWDDPHAGGKNSLHIEVRPAQEAEYPKDWEGFRPVSDVGAQGYVGRDPVVKLNGGIELGGRWFAGTVLGKDYVEVTLKGPKAAADAAVGLLKETIKRRQ